MKRCWQLAAGCLLILFLAVPARAESPFTDGLRQPEMIQQMSFAAPTAAEEEGETIGESPSDVPLEIAEPSLAMDVGCCPGPACGHGGWGCNSRGCGFGGDKPWTLPQPCAFQRLGIKVGGWLEHGITLNADAPVDRFNGPVATNDRHGEYQMNQLWLYLSKPTNTGGCGFDIGGHIDMLYGSDFRFGINYGLEDRINSVDEPYGMVIPQAYLEVAYNNLTVKLGHFAGILDYEVVPAPLNPLYSHSYSYGYTVPQLVTGALADYRLNDRWSVQAGFTRGWFMFEDVNDDFDFMGGVKWQSCDKRTSLAFAVNTGPQDPPGENNRFVYSLVAKHQLTRKLQYILVHNLGYEDNADPRTGNDAEWYGINQYFLYTINPCWAFNVRAEWLRDDDGARIYGIPNVIPPVRTWPGAPGFAGNFYEVTVGLNWRPHPNVVFRPECRWDWYEGTRNVQGQFPFDDGNSDDQFLFGVDMIVTY